MATPDIEFLNQEKVKFIKGRTNRLTQDQIRPVLQAAHGICEDCPAFYVCNPTTQTKDRVAEINGKNFGTDTCLIPHS